MPSFKNQNENKNAKPSNSINEVSKKGKTLGAEHASHGDFGVEKSNLKSPQEKTSK